LEKVLFALDIEGGWPPVDSEDVWCEKEGGNIDDQTLSHISLLPFKHVLPSGAYFIED